ncbi:MAG: hypothetical protein K0S76_2838 [Herbinix sp.]|jgi:putative nucleotidyltransferase with HDIG domain|nr:hypothetical protein [Herbinix sp.]
MADKVELFEEITAHLLGDDRPSEYMIRLSKEPEFKQFPLVLLSKLMKTEQSKKHHPEGNVWNHTMLVLDEAAKVRNQSKEEASFMWAALLHDIGKPDTTIMRKGRLTSYDHDKIGAKLCQDFLHVFTNDEEFIQRVEGLVRYHMHMLYVLKSLPYADTKNLLRNVDIHEIALLCRCDRLGRTGADADKEEEEYQEFIQMLERLVKKNVKV